MDLRGEGSGVARCLRFGLGSDSRRERNAPSPYEVHGSNLTAYIHGGARFGSTGSSQYQAFRGTLMLAMMAIALYSTRAIPKGRSRSEDIFGMCAVITGHGIMHCNSTKPLEASFYSNFVIQSPLLTEEHIIGG